MKQYWMTTALAVLIWLLATGSVWAKPDQQRVISLLEGYEWSLRTDLVERLGVDADLTLMEIAQDKQNQPNYRRFRALIALSLYNSDRVADFFEQYIDEQSNVHQKRRAFLAYSNGFYKQNPDRVSSKAAELIQHKNVFVRIEAARTLSKLSETQRTTGSNWQQYFNPETEAWAIERVNQGE